MDFPAISGIQTLSTDTAINATTYPYIFLSGFQQSGPPAVAAVAELYFSNAGNWYVYMSADTFGNAITYNINYAYRQ
jgi:hypothetical protein